MPFFVYRRDVKISTENHKLDTVLKAKQKSFI